MRGLKVGVFLKNLRHLMAYLVQILVNQKIDRQIYNFRMINLYLPAFLLVDPAANFQSYPLLVHPYPRLMIRCLQASL